MNKPLYYHIIQYFNPSLSDLPPLREILDLSIKKQITQLELIKLIQHYKSQITNTHQLTFSEFIQNFIFSSKDYEILLTTSLQELFPDIELLNNFRNFSIFLSQNHLFTQDQVFELFLALQENEINSIDELFTLSNSLFLSLNATNGVISEFLLAKFISNLNFHSPEIEKLINKIHSFRAKFGTNLAFSTQKINENLKEFLIFHSAEFRFNQKFDQNLVILLTKEAKKRKIDCQNIQFFVLKLREFYTKIIDFREENVVCLRAELGDKISTFDNIDLMILEADWKEVESGDWSGEGGVENENVSEIDGDVTVDEGGVDQLERRLKGMRG